MPLLHRIHSFSVLKSLLPLSGLSKNERHSPFQSFAYSTSQKARPTTRITGKWVFVVSQRAQLPHSYFTQVSGHTSKVLFQTCRRFDFCQIFGMFDLAPWFNKNLKMGKTRDFQHQTDRMLQHYICKKSKQESLCWIYFRKYICFGAVERL